MKLRFLLDENVKRRLEKFLVSRGFDAISAPKGVSNGGLVKKGLAKRYGYI